MRLMIVMILVGLLTGCIGDPQWEELNETEAIEEVKIKSLIESSPEEKNDYWNYSQISYTDMQSKNLTASLLHTYDSKTVTFCETLHFEDRTVEYCRPGYEYDYHIIWTIMHRNKNSSCFDNIYQNPLLTEFEIMELEGTNLTLEDLILSKFNYKKSYFRIISRSGDESYACEWIVGRI